MDENTIKLFGSKKTDHWQTPRELYKKLDAEFCFDMDPCPLEPKEDGLKIPWKGCVFVNPTYSQVRKWLEKANEEIEEGNANVIVFLVFANTDTAWFHDLVFSKAEIRFLRGRLKFLDKDGKEQNSAMRPSMLVIFRHRDVDHKEKLQ